MSFMQRVVSSRFWVFSIGGGLGAIVNWAITVALTELLLIPWEASYAVGLSINFLLNFFFNMMITFRKHSEALRRFVRFLAVSISTILLNYVSSVALENILGAVISFRFNYLVSIILVTGGIGDVLLSTPLIRVLKKQYPDASISYLCGRWSAGVLENNPHVSEVIPVDDSVFFRFFSRLRLIQLIFKIRKKRFDMVFILDK